MCLAVFDPNIIAHSAIAGTDNGAALLIVLSLWVATKFYTSYRRNLCVPAGLILGMALASKITAVLLLFPIRILCLVTYLKQCRTDRKITLQYSVFMFCIAFITL